MKDRNSARDNEGRGKKNGVRESDRQGDVGNNRDDETKPTKKNEFLHDVNRIKRGGWRRARELKPKIVQNANKGSKFINTEMTKSIPLE